MVSDMQHQISGYFQLSICTLYFNNTSCS